MNLKNEAQGSRSAMANSYHKETTLWTDNHKDLIPVFRPTMPSLPQIMEVVSSSYESGVITLGRLTNLFEEEARAFTGAQYAVAVANCTSGLMLAFAALELSPGSEVIVPSFTFAATVQAIHWNNLTPVYVDCLPNTMTMDPGEVEKAVSPKTSCIYPVNVFGLPPDLSELEPLSTRYGVPLIIDSAQGLGSTYRGQRSGTFGLMEVFSLSPTKVVTAVEGGLVTTNDVDFAQKMRSMRDYGKGAEDEGMVFNGLSARISEFHAAVGLLGLRNAQQLISVRMALIHRYRSASAHLDGCRVQEFPADRTTSGNYFTLVIGETARNSRDQVYEALKARGVQTKKYFYPPVHVQPAFRNRPHRIVGNLANTWEVSRNSLALPLFAHMAEEQQDRVVEALNRLLG